MYFLNLQPKLQDIVIQILGKYIVFIKKYALFNKSKSCYTYLAKDKNKWKLNNYLKYK